jgi:membrane-associated phospholipid phosphatase
VVPAAWHYLGWKGGVGATTLATFTALGRLEDNRHYVSDVVAGGAIGLVVGLAVISQRENSVAGPDVVILPRGMALSWHF